MMSLSCGMLLCMYLWTRCVNDAVVVQDRAGIGREAMQNFVGRIGEPDMAIVQARRLGILLRITREPEANV